MRIYVAHNTYQQASGEDAVVRAEAAMLRAAGHEVTVGLVSNNEIDGPTRRMSAFLGTSHNRRRAKWMALELERTDAQILHVHNFFPLLSPSIHHAAAMRGVAVVQTLHNYRLLCAAATFLRKGTVCEKCLHGSRMSAVVHRCYRGSVTGSLAVAAMQSEAERRQTWHTAVDRFVALSEFARQKFIEGGLPAERIVVKPNFVAGYDGPLPDHRFGALFVGRLSPEKGVDVLLEAWRHLPGTPLTIVGDGPERTRLQAIAPPNVTFTGSLPRTDILSWMLRSAVLVVPSLWSEPFGMVVIEAFSAGLPVIASDIGGLPELVTPGSTGALFRAGDADDLVRAASSVLADTRRPPGFAESTRKEQSERFAEPANLRQLEGIYAEAVATRSAIRGAV